MSKPTCWGKSPKHKFHIVWVFITMPNKSYFQYHKKNYSLIPLLQHLLPNKIHLFPLTVEFFQLAGCRVLRVRIHKKSEECINKPSYRKR